MAQSQYTIASGQQFGAVVKRMVNMGMHLPDSVVDRGMDWYPSVHEIVKGQSRDAGLSLSQGSGIVAAVSPNVEFASKNIKALEEIGNLSPQNWDDIHRSASRRFPTGHKDAGKQMPRLPEVKAMLSEVVPSISGVYDDGFAKAHRILQGQEWRDVLTAPKTPSFAENIEDPSSTKTTVDGRFADVIANKRVPWKDERGLTKARDGRGLPGVGRGAYPRGESRYDSFERVTDTVRDRLVGSDPRFAGASSKDIQATLWVGAEGIERSQLTQKGTQRTDGERREGQPYVTPSGQPLERDSHFWDQA